ncbi:hypothetical protein A2U01_0014118, partial [Trifolium medium]|nr:hypothetical protein [Trifolium medium]
MGSVTILTSFKDNDDPSSARTIQVKYIMVPCNAAYICILGRPALNSLGAVPSTVHLKMRYHGINVKVDTIRADNKALKR